ncbi:MAG: RNA polymerase sigma factor [Phycisphaerae bacterium]
MNEPESKVIESAVAGEAAAMRTLLERYGPQVWHEIRSKIGRQWQSIVDADDVMQVTYVEAFLQIHMLTARDGVGFMAWLRRIAENNMRDAIKEQDRKKRPPPGKRLDADAREDSCIALIETLGVESTTPSRHAAAGEASKIIVGVLEQLPTDYARVVQMYDLDGREIADVAAELNRSTGAVHMLRARAHDRLRVLLGAPGNFFSES